MQSYEGDHVRGEADGHAEEIFEKSASRSALSLQHRAKRAYEDQSQAHLSSTSACLQFRLTCCHNTQLRVTAVTLRVTAMPC